MAKPLRTIEGMAEVLSIRPGTMRLWVIQYPDLPKIRLGRLLRFDEDAVLEWVRAGNARPVTREDRRAQRGASSPI